MIRVCPHGVRLSCGAVHADDDPRLGEPLCPECFDYPAAVTWNHALGELWRYTTIYVPRAMAQLAGMTQAALKREVRPAYVKVAEYQRRGLVHLHVLVRLDRAMPDYRADELHPPAPRFGVELLEDALRKTIAEVSAPVAAELGGGRVRWGGQLDVRRLDEGDARGEVAGYLAKYATKSTEQAGGLLHRDRRRPGRRRQRPRARPRTTCAPRSTWTPSPSSAHRAAPTSQLPPATSRQTGTRPRSRSACNAQWEQARRCACDSTTNTTHVGRVVRLLAQAERRDTTLVVELDTGARVHLADVASIGPRPGRPPAVTIDATRGWRRARTPSGTAVTA